MEVTQAGGTPIKIWIKDMWNNLEPQALEQAKKVSRLPFIHKHVALMPDAHLGKGACVGSVIASAGAVVPALVGVDIGCGMFAAKTNLNANDLPDSLREIRFAIEAVVPVGHNSHKNARNFEKSGMDPTKLTVYDQLDSRVQARLGTQIGTLGGGNHFVEICLDENSDVWIMMHSGSRNIGKEVAERHIGKAQGIMKQLFIQLEDKDLSYFAAGTVEYQNYLHDVMWCQEYAMKNRQAMFDNTFDVMKKVFPQLKVVGDVTSCHHNYISLENHYGKNVIVTRKGAIRAREGDLGIIPGSMGTKSYIVRGLGNKESFCSCSHGAGRVMSRSEAKRTFTIEDLKAQTEGVECRKDAGAIDEIPGAYKDIDTVMENQSDLVEIMYTLKQVMCIKG
jgi:tRNA-splicing ligase RtcB